MNTLLITKALANPTRVDIVSWLKKPKKHFPHANKDTLSIGICCGQIQEKAGLSQSTISNYLGMLEASGLLIATRHKQWTYYQRNEKAIQAYIDQLRNIL